MDELGPYNAHGQVARGVVGSADGGRLPIAGHGSRAGVRRKPRKHMQPQGDWGPGEWSASGGSAPGEWSASDASAPAERSASGGSAPARPVSRLGPAAGATPGRAGACFVFLGALLVVGGLARALALPPASRVGETGSRVGQSSPVALLASENSPGASTHAKLPGPLPAAEPVAAPEPLLADAQAQTVAVAAPQDEEDESLCSLRGVPADDEGPANEHGGIVAVEDGPATSFPEPDFVAGEVVAEPQSSCEASTPSTAIDACIVATPLPQPTPIEPLPASPPVTHPLVHPAPAHASAPLADRGPPPIWVPPAAPRSAPPATAFGSASDDEPLPPADDVLPPAEDLLPPADDLLPPVGDLPPPGPEAAPRGAPSTGNGASANGRANDDVADYASVPVEERPIVRGIEFEGARLYGAGSVEARMRLKVGRRLDPVLLESDLAELRKFFSEISVVEEIVPDGIVLRFLVRENAMVERLVLRGLAEMEESEITAMLRTKEGYPLSRIHLDQDREDVAAAYRTRGFRFASVPDPLVTTLPSGGLRVDFVVFEGPKVEVATVVFRGNRNLRRDDLLEVMQIREPGFLEAIFSSVIFREDALREDLLALEALYRSHGFLDAEVVLEDLRFSDDKSRVEVTIGIDEGSPYTVGTIEVELVRVDPGTIGAPSPGDIAYFTEDTVRSLFGLRPGERWSGEKADEGVAAIREAYIKRSFHDVRVETPTRRARLDGHVVDLLLEVKEGAKFRLARIDIVGNEYTRDHILRREVKTAPGDYVDGTELEKGLSRMRRTTWFSRSTLDLADATGPDGEPLPGWKTATYELVEASTGSANFGFTLGTGGLGAFIALRKKNFDIARFPTSWDDLPPDGGAFTGAGQTFEIMIAPSTDETAFSVSFGEPRLFGSELGFGATIYRRIAFREDYDIDRFGYGIDLSYPLWRAADDSRALSATAHWRHEWVEIQDVGPLAVPGVFLFQGEQEVRTLGAGLRFATVDDLRNPRLETTSSLRFEVGGGGLGGDIDFTKVLASNSSVLNLYETEDGGQHRLTLTSGIGWAQAFDDTPEVPIFERFGLGGRDLRGFALRGVGPHVNGNPTLGEAYWRSSLEYEFPIAPQKFSLVAFLDAGAVEPTLDDLDFSDTRLAVGFGLRIAIPGMGDRPLAIDFGFALRKKDEDEEQLVSFSFGRTF